MIPMLPEPCDSGEPSDCPVPPLGLWDLRGQLDGPEIAATETVPIVVDGVL